MSKSNDFLHKSIQYITSVLNSDIEVKPLSKKDLTLIPLFIGSSYRLYESRLLGMDVCLLVPKDETNYTPTQMEKQMQLLQSKLNLPAIFLLENVPAYNQNRLIAHRVNFIIPEKQLFIPALLITLKKTPAQPALNDTLMPPLSVSLLLYHLQKERLEGCTTQEIAEKFAVSYANANRAIRWLTQKELVLMKGEKEKTLLFPIDGQKLFKKALPLLPSPIESIGYTDETIEESQACLSGINALATYSMINPEEDKHYAFARSHWKDTGIVLDKQFGKHIIEIWRYDPLPLSQNGVVDKLSLYLCFKENEDERIQIELEQLINNIVWLTG